MKITIPRTDLLAALDAVKTAARGSSLPILGQVLLVADEKSVTLTGTNLDAFIRVRIDAIVNAKGDATIRAALLHDIARTATGENVSLETGKNSQLLIVCGDARFKITTLGPEEFPGWPRLGPDAVEFSLEDSVFRSRLQSTAFAAAQDPGRYTLCGTCLQIADELLVIATDGRRLALTSAEAPTSKKLQFIIPAFAVHELLRLLDGDPDKPKRLAVTVAKNLIQFVWGDTTLLAKLVDGQYPNHAQIMPPDQSPVATIDRALLLAAVDRVALVADEVKLDFGKSALAISSHGLKDKLMIGDATDRLLVPASRTVTVTLSARYLREALAATDEPSLEFHTAKNIHLLKTVATAERPWRAVIAGTKDREETGKAMEKPEPK
jgi:DNA polymerase III subunit beta